MMDGADGAAGSADPKGPEFPTPETLRVYGDVLFLATRSPRHRAMSVANLREAIEPPILLGQYHIFRFDGIPRGLITWGLLDRDAEETYVEGGPLGVHDWRSGDNLWIVDIMSPYRGLIAGMSRWIMTPGNLARSRFSFRRVEGERQTRRIVRVDLEAPRKAQVMTEAQFLADR